MFCQLLFSPSFVILSPLYLIVLGPLLCILPLLPVFYLQTSSSLLALMGIKRFDHKTKVKARSERRNLQAALQLCTKQVGTVSQKVTYLFCDELSIDSKSL